MMNFIFDTQINIEVFCRLMLSFWLIIIRNAQRNPTKFAYLGSISRKATAIQLVFYLQINKKSFLQADSIILGVPTQAFPKNTKEPVYNIFSISKRKRKGWSLFLIAGNYRRFLQSDTIIFDVYCQTCPIYPK